MKILSLLLVAGVIVLSVVGCGGASFSTSCKQHCEACGGDTPCCNDNCLGTIGGPRCVSFVGEILQLTERRALLVTLVALAGLGTSTPQGAVADDPVARPATLAVSGFPLPDGTAIFPHPGLVHPAPSAARPDERWVVRKTGRALLRGKVVDVHRYVRVDGGEETSSQPAEYVDPTTGSVVAGGDLPLEPTTGETECSSE